LNIKLSNGKKAKYAAALAHHGLRITLRGAAAFLSLTIKAPAITVSKSLAAKVRMHKIGRLKIRIKLTDANGSSTVLVTPTSPH
jgi:hypothetical protein